MICERCHGLLLWAGQGWLACPPETCERRRRATIAEILASGDAIENPVHSAVHVGSGLQAIGASQAEIAAALAERRS